MRQEMMGFLDGSGMRRTVCKELGKSEEKRISEEAYDINKQTINMVPKSKIEPRAHYTLKPTHYI